MRYVLEMAQCRPPDSVGIRTLSGRWSAVPVVLGVLLIADGSANFHEIMTSVRDPGWSTLMRVDSGLLGGFCLLWGLSPKWSRIVAMAICLIILIFDIRQGVAGSLPRHYLGQVATGPTLNVAGDLLILGSLLRWRPAMGRPAWINFYPWQLVGTAVIAIFTGIAVDRSHIGQSPIVAATLPDGLGYLAYLPEGYHWSYGRWPLILTLHGAGLEGHDTERIRNSGLPRRLETRGWLPFIVVAPQSPARGWDETLLDALLDQVEATYRVDRDQIFLTGSSMGGHGTWAWAAARPRRFAAIAPICGWGDPTWAERLRSVPTWAFHGAEDRVIPPGESRVMINALEQAGGHARLTVYPGVGHDAWTITYEDARLYNWFRSHRRRSAGEN